MSVPSTRCSRSSPGTTTPTSYQQFGSDIQRVGGFRRDEDPGEALPVRRQHHRLRGRVDVPAALRRLGRVRADRGRRHQLAVDLQRRHHRLRRGRAGHVAHGNQPITADGFTTSPSSGATAATRFANEFVLGVIVQDENLDRARIAVEHAARRRRRHRQHRQLRVAVQFGRHLHLLGYRVPVRAVGCRGRHCLRGRRRNVFRPADGELPVTSMRRAGACGGQPAGGAGGSSAIGACRDLRRQRQPDQRAAQRRLRAVADWSNTGYGTRPGSPRPIPASPAPTATPGSTISPPACPRRRACSWTAATATPSPTT